MKRVLPSSAAAEAYAETPSAAYGVFTAIFTYGLSSRNGD